MTTICSNTYYYRVDGHRTRGQPENLSLRVVKGNLDSGIGDIFACGIGHFRVPKNLTFKTRLRAKPLL